MIEIGYECRDRIAHITLNRPEAKNAVTPADARGTVPHLGRLPRQRRCRCRDPDRCRRRLLCRRRSRDLRADQLCRATPSRVRDIVDMGFGGITRGLHRITKPTIAAVNGWALAGGLELALACDLRITSERAMFGSFEARRGFHHGDGGITRLVNTVGVGVAMQMVLTAEPIDAQRALQCNMVTKVVPHEQLMQEAELLARQILRNSQRAVRSAKETILEVSEAARRSAAHRGLEFLHLRRSRGGSRTVESVLRQIGCREGGHEVDPTLRRLRLSPRRQTGATGGAGRTTAPV